MVIEHAARRFKVILERDAKARAWVTYVPTLGLSTYGDSRAEALAQTRDAILGYMEAASKEGIAFPAADADPEIVDLEVATP